MMRDTLQMPVAVAGLGPWGPVEICELDRAQQVVLWGLRHALAEPGAGCVRRRELAHFFGSLADAVEAALTGIAWMLAELPTPGLERLGERRVSWSEQCALKALAAASADCPAGFERHLGGIRGLEMRAIAGYFGVVAVALDLRSVPAACRTPAAAAANAAFVWRQ